MCVVAEMGLARMLLLDISNDLDERLQEISNVK